MKVAVVGGGTAGCAAATEAAGLGASVVLYETTGALRSPRSSWPSVLAGRARGPEGTAERLGRASVETELGQRVASVDADCSLTVGGARRRYDAVVMATGSRPVPEPIAGGGKRGVHLLASEEEFYALKEACGGYGTAAVYGSGIVSAEVAERLHSLGIRVTLLAPGGLLSTRLNEGPRRLLLSAAESTGIRVVDAKPERVVGVDRVEAVVAASDVIPCGALAVVPRSEPSLPEVLARRGRSGRVVVTDDMRSSLKGVFAAGSCAEVEVGSIALQVSLGSSAESTGRVAGANAAGTSASTKATESFFRSLFGLEVASSGLSAWEASMAGIDAVEDSREWDAGLCCSLVAERRSGAVLGGQLVGRQVARFAAALPAAVSCGARLNDLAYAESLYPSDISPISETAREALRRRW